MSMFLNRLKLLNVRNHKTAEFLFEKDTLFAGENGSGKTTVLESIYLLFAMRGFKKQPLSNVISFDEHFLRIEGEICSEDSTFLIVLKYDGQKSLYINETPIEKISDYLYNLPIACYTPDSQGILSSSQTERRNFIDRFIFYTDKSHIEDLRIYNRFIAQKAAAFEEDNIDETYIDILNEKIIPLSSKISKKRLDFINIINTSLDNNYSNFPYSIEKIFLSYKTNIKNMDILNKEIKTGRCDYGTHRDKIDMCLDSKVIEKFSSVGQKKTFVLLSLLSALKNVEITRKISIITLLDDFEATLDRKRASLLKELFCEDRQAIFSGVENERLGFKNVINL